MHKKYWERELEDWSPEIVTATKRSNDGRGFYAWLDVGPQQYPSDPDFSTYATTKKQAINLCYEKILEHQDKKRLTLRGYDLRFRLGKWWRIKELGLQHTPEIKVITEAYFLERNELFRRYELPEELH